jgi:hypothetical protein
MNLGQLGPLSCVASANSILACDKKSPKVGNFQSNGLSDFQDSNLKFFFLQAKMAQQGKQN